MGDSLFVYNLSTKSFVYDFFEDAGGFPFHILGIMGVEVLSNSCVGMSEPRCHIDEVCPCLNQARCVGVTEAM